MSNIAVSVIVPAYNAADTLGEALASLQNQTFTAWEVIVVDDGSTDDTASVVQALAQEDGRINLIRQSNAGGGAARNRGLEVARNPWILFFDADDWLLPQHLEKLTERAASDDNVDAVHCGWRRVSPDGELGQPNFAPDLPDLFSTFAKQCAFMIHTCLVKRELVSRVGRLDTSLQTCQDWDLWQRVARTGARFAAVPEVLALYRSRPGSVSLDGPRQLQDSLRVISQAYRPDSRVPDGPYAAGLPPENAAGARIRFACWSFGLILGSGVDARPYLDLLANDTDETLSPEYVAACLFEAGLLPRGLSSSGWDQLWPEVAENVNRFLPALASQVGAPALAAEAQRLLAMKILDHSLVPRPYFVGGTQAIVLEVTEPLADYLVEPAVSHLYLEVKIFGEAIGAVSVSVTQPKVTAAIIRRAVAEAYAWPILMRFFELELFGQLSLVRGPGHVSVWRGDLCLGTHPGPVEDEALWDWVRSELGWTLLLQEVWQRPQWPNDYFYDETFVEPPAKTAVSAGDQLTVRPGRPLPDVSTRADALDLKLAIAAGALPPVTVPVVAGLVSATEIRRRLTVAAGFALCQLVVEQALVGVSWVDQPLLSQRLMALANPEFEQVKKSL